jgi:hypothetical protein
MDECTYQRCVSVDHELQQVLLLHMKLFNKCKHMSVYYIYSAIREEGALLFLLNARNKRILRYSHDVLCDRLESLRPIQICAQLYRLVQSHGPPT